MLAYLFVCTRSNCKILVNECIDTKRATEQFDSDTFCDMLTNRLTATSQDYGSTLEEKEGLLSADDYVEAADESSSRSASQEETESSCIDLTQFSQLESQKAGDANGTTKMNAMSTSGEVDLNTHNVCKENKCTKEQLCLRNQDCTVENCEPYRCVNACTIGECVFSAELFLK